MGEATAVIETAAGVLFRHWPALFTLSFAGLGARALLTSAAVEASKVNAALGFLVFVLVPMTTLTSLVLMMRVVRGSLPWLFLAERRGSDAAGTPAAARGALLDHLGSVLIPFLAVYASYGYLKQDLSNYVYSVLYDAVFNNADIFNGGAIDVASRLPFSLTTSVVSVVVVSVVARFVLGKWKLAKRYGWLGIVGAYVEVIWISLVAGLLSQLNGTSHKWVEDRRVVHGLVSGLDAAVDHLGPLAGLGHAVLSIVGTLFDSVDTVIVVPVAWLAVGAVVYGYKIAPAEPLAIELQELLDRRWSRMPGVVRRVGAEAGASLRERFGPLIRGLQLLTRTGLRPMLLFCLAFVIIQPAATWLWEIERWLIGPHNLTQLWMPLSKTLSTFNDGVSLVLLVALLGSAVDRVLRVQQVEVSAPAASTARADAAAPMPSAPMPTSAMPSAAMPVAPMPVAPMPSSAMPVPSLVPAAPPRSWPPLPGSPAPPQASGGPSQAPGGPSQAPGGPPPGWPPSAPAQRSWPQPVAPMPPHPAPPHPVSPMPVPAQTMPPQSVPLQSVPSQSVPSQAVPLQAMPQRPVAQPAPPLNVQWQNPAPQPPLPRTAPPQQAYPQQAYPQQAYPQSAYPQPAYPQSAYPQPMAVPSVPPAQAQVLPSPPAAVAPPADPAPADPAPADPAPADPAPADPAPAVDPPTVEHPIVGPNAS
ncbi:hypothetical protein [Rugosimonospora acidiphila]|uniref:hypothetical protein n=1 Tax=Rugosimonospora acidiphila TaxID=556531 RepID=UPI0031EAA63E